MLCHQCGSPVDASDRSCPNCGASLVKTTRFDIATSKGLRISQELRAIKLDDQMFPPGETIEKRYRLGELIGKGPLGEVFKAHDTELDVDVAIKIFHKALIHSPMQQERFTAATRHARGISQANVVRMHDSGVHKDHPWVSMQYLEGLSLRKVLGLRRSKGENFGLDEIEPVIGQIGLALAHTDRDAACANLKPENIIFMPDLLKVTDTYVLAAFGLDALRERSNDSAYLAPELHTEGSEPDARADVYSLGVIIGEMAFGADYTPGSNVAAGLKGLDALCRRATAFSRDERYLSVEALLEDLTTLVDTGHLVEPLTPPAPPKPPAPPASTGAKVLVPPPAPMVPPPAPSVNAVDDAQIEEEIATVEYSRVDEPEIQDLLATNEVGRTPLKRPTPPRGSSARIHTQTVQSGPPAAPEVDNTKWWAIAGVALLVGGVVLWKINQTKPSGDDVVQLGSKVTTTPATTTSTQNQPAPSVAETVANNAPATATQTNQTTVQTAAQTTEQLAQTNQAAATAAQTATQPVVVEKPPTVVENTVVASVTPPVVKDPPPVEVNEPAKPAGNGTECPSGSALVKSKSGNYCVDLYEFPGSGAPPKTRVNWFEAKKLCASSGKRLCTLTEWKGACGSKYPYGSTFDANSCNTADEDGFERSLAKAGSSKSCRSRSGAYDMSGNVHEWVEEKRIAGGSYESDEDVASCRYSSAKAPGSSAADIGFRCCADPE